MNFSITRTKVEVEYKAMESVLSIQSSKMKKKALRTLSWGVWCAVGCAGCEFLGRTYKVGSGK